MNIKMIYALLCACIFAQTIVAADRTAGDARKELLADVQQKEEKVNPREFLLKCKRKRAEIENLREEVKKEFDAAIKFGEEREKELQNVKRLNLK